MTTRTMNAATTTATTAFVSLPLHHFSSNLRCKSSPLRRFRIKSCSTGASTSDKLLVVGLGNPGPRFKNTRHNVGFEVADLFAARSRTQFKNDKRLQAEIATAHIGERVVHILKPRTFMNLSGNAVRAALKWYNISPQRMLIVVDDISLQVGRIRLRAKGSSGGHNGLKSIESVLRSTEYARLKVGVGMADGAHEWKEHVLGKFSGADTKALEDVLWNCAEILDVWVGEDDINKVISRVGNIANSKR